MSDLLFDTMGGQLGRLSCGRPANEALRVALDDASADGAAFAEYLVGGAGGVGEAPDYFLQCVGRNVGCAAPDLEGQKADVPARDCRWLASAQRGGEVVVVHVRETDQYAPCHARGSYNFPLGTHGGIVLGHEDGNFSLWLGKLFAWREDHRVALVVDAERRDEALTRIARVGILRYVVGVVDGCDLVAHGEDGGVEMGSCRRWAAENIRQAASLRYIDVRTPGEFKCPRLGTVRGAINVPLAQDKDMQQTAEEAGVAKDILHLCFCAGGFRSAIATTLLRRAGYTVEDVKFGYLTFTGELPELTTVSGRKRKL